MFVDFNFPNQFITYRFPLHKDSDDTFFFLLKTDSVVVDQFATGKKFKTAVFDGNSYKSIEYHVIIINISASGNEKSHNLKINIKFLD
ncbi:MAG: hypothetical protein PF503_14255 [Desulfobacula sp.]|jgi:hypothetical protein|nr:hypothetical protein [Desulfobacula sp.]